MYVKLLLLIKSCAFNLLKSSRVQVPEKVPEENAKVRKKPPRRLKIPLGTVNLS